MDAYDEILGLCKARDAKRKELEAVKSAALEKPPENMISAKPKPKATIVKPLSYEELMSRAEQNSNNTLSLTDLKAKTTDGPIVRESCVKAVKVPEIKRSYNVPVRADTKKMVSKSVVEKKSVKIIKRNMQPRNEVSDLVVLNQKKRDLRSIEEIQMELRQSASKSKTLAKPQTESKPKSAIESEKNTEKYYAKNYSSIISNIFGYDRNKYAGIEDDDLSDMEADYRTVMAEEARCARIGKQEDLEEEAKELERKKRKAALLKSQKLSK